MQGWNGLKPHRQVYEQKKMEKKMIKRDNSLKKDEERSVLGALETYADCHLRELDHFQLQYPFLEI